MVVVALLVGVAMEAADVRWPGQWLVLGSVIVLGLPLDWPDRQRRDANRAAWYAEQVRLERPRRSATWVRDGTDPEGQPMSRRFNRLANLQG